MLQLHVALQPAVQHPKRSRNNQPFQRLPERAGERRLGISDAVALGKAMAETLFTLYGNKTSPLIALQLQRTSSIVRSSGEPTHH